MRENSGQECVGQSKGDQTQEEEYQRSAAGGFGVSLLATHLRIGGEESNPEAGGDFGFGFRIWCER